MELKAPSNNGGSSSQEPKADPESSQSEQTEQTQEPYMAQSSLFEEIDSTCSTPYVSAPSSPGRGSGPVNGGFYYSAPASPMHFALTASYPTAMSSYSSSSSPDNGSSSVALGFEFGSGSSANGSSMSSADELFLDGKIRPMKLSTHLERPQVLAPLLDLDEEEDDEKDESAEEIRSSSSSRGRDHMRVVLRDKSMRRRTRSLSPLRSTSLKWNEESAFVIDDAKESKSSDSCLGNNKVMAKNEVGCEIHDHDDINNNESSDTAAVAAASASASASLSASTSRSSSAGRSTSKRWVFLKDFLYRSKSEGRSNNKFWSTISFSPVHKEKKLPTATTSSSSSNTSSSSSSSSKENSTSESITNQRGKESKGHHHQGKKPVNGIGKRRVPPSPHELHYTANRAQAEEMRKKTFLPYRQGLLGCLGFSSKGYGAMNGFARALNPVSSR